MKKRKETETGRVLGLDERVYCNGIFFRPIRIAATVASGRQQLSQHCQLYVSRVETYTRNQILSLIPLILSY
jgi:hypothetical protein